MESLLPMTSDVHT